MENKAGYSERELLTEVAEGNEQAFRRLFHTYKEFLAAHLLKFTRSPELMEEIVQDVFLKIWLRREALTEVENFKAYLVIVSRNQALNALDKILRELKRKEAYLKNISYLEGDMQEEYINLRASLLDQAVEALPPRQKEVYLLHRHARLTYEQVAEIMGISRETVKSQLKAAISFITSYIKQQIAISIAFSLLSSFF